MFSTSTQIKHWMFQNNDELRRLRDAANRKFVEMHCADDDMETEEDDKRERFLTSNEEMLLCKQYEHILKDFCRKFKPPMPSCVVGTSMQYFKRFYLHNSVMDYHPKHLVVTCVYLAAKVEEFNVSINQFVGNVKGDREKAVDVILSNELLLMQQLNYHLTVHNPFRPLEGILIDIKTRCPELQDPEKLRLHINDFLEKSLFTDACLLFAPSQIALAAVHYATNKLNQGTFLNSYENKLLNNSRDKVNNLLEIIKTVWSMVKNIEILPRSEVKEIERKLEICRNQENNPESQIYKRRQLELLNQEEGDGLQEYVRVSQEQQWSEEHILTRKVSSDFPI